MNDAGRRCVACEAGISACMGFVLARDFVARVPRPREVCGKCALTLEPADVADDERLKGKFFEEDDCLGPCPYPGCADCERYWERIVEEGLWVPGEGWTKKALLGAAGLT